MLKHSLRTGLFAALAVAAGLSITPAPVRADDTEQPQGEAAAAESKDWKDHMGDIPFLVGREAGDAEAEFTGKPPMYFFTTTW